MTTEKKFEDLGGEAMLHALKTIASSVTSVVLAAKVLHTRKSEPAVAEWFADRNTRAALLAWEKIDEAERAVLQQGPTALCSDHVPQEDAPWQCAKCGKPLGPVPPHDAVTASLVAEFALQEGFALVAVVGMRTEATGLPGAGPGTQGAMFRVDGAMLMRPDAPPVAHELALQLRSMADQIEREATAAGQGIVNRVPVPKAPKGEN